MLRRKIVGVFVIYAFLLPTLALGQSSPKVYEAPKEVLDKIKEEGTKNSQIMQTLGYMSDVAGCKACQRLDARHACKMGLAECSSRIVGTIRSRLDALAIYGYGRWTDRISVDRVPKGVVTRH